MSTPRISVIMPVFNAAHYLRDAIESVLAQTFRDFELIIIDDGSTDDSRQVAGSIRDDRIRRYDNPKNLGAAKTKNRAIENALGEWIAFLDADDIAMPQRFAEQIDFSTRNPAVDVIGSQIEIIDENGMEAGNRRVLPCNAEEIGPTFLFENCIAQSSVMLRRSILSHERFRTEMEPAEDYDLWTRLLKAARFANLDHALVKYRIHPGGVSARKETAMKTSVRSVHAAQIARLNLAATPSQLDMHGRLSQWPPPAAAEMIRCAEDWLRMLKKANASSGCYTPAVFEKIIALLWYSICLGSWQVGIRAFTSYWQSPLHSLEWVTVLQHLQLLRLTAPVSLRKVAGIR